MAKDDVTFQVGIDAKDAQKSIKKFEKSSKKSFSNIKKAGKDAGKGFDSIRKGIDKAADSLFSFKGAIAGVLAGAGLVKFIDSVTEAAAVQETAIKGLSFALENSKDSSIEALEGFEQYASALQDSTGLADETALSIIGLAKSFGASDKSARDFAAASIELAAVTGKTVEETSRQLVKSLGGLAGELGEISPIFKNLTAEQLRAGGAAKAVLENFGGAAAAQLDTFAGSVDALGGRFGDFQEALGRIITENPAVAKVIGSLSDGFKTLTKFVDDNADKIRKSFNKVLLETLKLARSTVRGLSILAESFDLDVSDPFESIAGSIKTIRDGIDTVTGKILEFQRQTGKVVDGQRPLIDQNKGKGFFENFFNTGFGKRDLKQATGDQVKILKERNEKVFKLQEDLAKKLAREKFPNAFAEFEIPKDSQSKAEKALDDLIKSLQEEADKQAIELKVSPPKPPPAPEVPSLALPGQNTEKEASLLDGILKQRNEDEKKAAEEQLKAEEKAREEFIQALKDTFAGIADGFVSVISGGLFDAISDGLQSLADIPVGFANSISSLETLIDGVPQSIDLETGEVTPQIKGLATVITEAGNAIPGLIENLAKRFAKEFPKIARAFTDALPKIIKALSDSLPGIIGTIVDALPGIISKLLDGFAGFIDLLPGIFEKIFSALPAIFDSIFDKLPKIITSIFNALPSIVKSLADAIPGIIESLADNLDEIIIALVEGIIGAMGEIVAALIESFLLEGGAERIVGAILRAIPRVIVALVQGFARGVTRAFEAIASLFFGNKVEFDEEKLKTIFSDIGEKIKSSVTDGFKPLKEGFDKLSSPFRRLVEALDNLRASFGGGKDAGGVAGFFQDIGRKNASETLSNFGVKVPGRATGGTVPNGFPGDNFPAMLQSGELIVPRNDVTDLREFLAQERRGSGALAGNEEITALLASIAGNTAGGSGGVVTLNEDGLTELLLDFSRRNERTVA